MNSIDVLKALVNGTVTTNGTKQITGATLNNLLNNMVDNLFTPAGTVRIWPGVIIPMGWSKCDGSVYPQPDHLQRDYADLFNSLGGPASPYGVQATTFNIPLILPAQNVIQYGIAAFIAGYTIQDDARYQIGEVLTAETPIGGVAATFKVLSEDIGTGNIGLKMTNSGKGYVTGGRYNLSGGTGTGAQIIINSAYDFGTKGGEEKHKLEVTEMPSHTHLQDAHNHGTGYIRTDAHKVDTESNGDNMHDWQATGNTTATNQNTGGNTKNNNATDPHNNMPPYMAMNYIIKLQ